jgi:diadenosine tetraphosphate (Ap4A) HIT family hydrolase
MLVLVVIACTELGRAFIVKPIDSTAYFAVRVHERGNVIFSTDYWQVYIKPNQSCLGGAIIRLNRVEDDLDDITIEELKDFLKVVRVMKIAAQEEFGAQHVNWVCLMNNGHVLTDPIGGYLLPFAIVQVHFHFHPRYDVPKTFAGLKFTDENWGHNYRCSKKRMVPDDVLQQIAEVYREAIRKLDDPTIKVIAQRP